MENQKNENKKRGCLLTGYLVLCFIGGVSGLFTYFLNQYLAKLGQPTQSEAMVIYATIASVATLVFAVGTWRMEKWGVFGLIAIQIIGCVANMIQGVPIWSLAFSVGFTVLLIFITRSVWGESKTEE